MQLNIVHQFEKNKKKKSLTNPCLSPSCSTKGIKWLSVKSTSIVKVDFYELTRSINCQIHPKHHAGSKRFNQERRLRRNKATLKFQGFQQTHFTAFYQRRLSTVNRRSNGTSPKDWSLSVTFTTNDSFRFTQNLKCSGSYVWKQKEQTLPFDSLSCSSSSQGEKKNTSQLSQTGSTGALRNSRDRSARHTPREIP